jgi:pilus assembly protein Flp/PilA
MKKFFRRFAREERGATAIEYGLIAGAMAIIIVAAFAVFDDQLQATFGAITGEMAGQATALEALSVDGAAPAAE